MRSKADKMASLV